MLSKDVHILNGMVREKTEDALYVEFYKEHKIAEQDNGKFEVYLPDGREAYANIDTVAKAKFYIDNPEEAKKMGLSK